MARILPTAIFQRNGASKIHVAAAARSMSWVLTITIPPYTASRPRRHCWQKLFPAPARVDWELRSAGWATKGFPPEESSPKSDPR